MVGFLGETETSSNALIAGGSPQSSSVGFLEDTGVTPNLEAILGPMEAEFSQKFLGMQVIADKLVEPLTELRKRANLNDLWDALVYAVTAFSVEGVTPFNIKFPENTLAVFRQLFDAVKQVAKAGWNVAKGLDWSVILTLIAVGIPIAEKFGIKFLKEKEIPTDKEVLNIRLDFIEHHLNIGNEDKWLNSVAGQRKALRSAGGFYERLGKKIGGNVGGAIGKVGPWWVAYRLAVFLLDVFEGSIYYAAHKIAPPAADVTDEEKGTRLGTHRSQPSITAWYGNDGIIRFYDKNDQEIRITTPDPWEFIIPDEGIKPSDYKRNGGLISGSRPMGDHRNNLIAV